MSSRTPHHIIATWDHHTMRKETRLIAEAFIQRKPKRAARSHTDGTAIYLHGHRIAWWEHDSSLSVTLAGWPSRTTMDRLNGLCELLGHGRPFHIVKSEPHHNDEKVSAFTVITYHDLQPT